MTAKSRSQPLQSLQTKTSNALTKTANLFENWFFCCAAHESAVRDDAIAYSLPDLPVGEEEEYESVKTRRPKNRSVRPSDSASSTRSDKAIAHGDDSFATGKSAGSIVFLDAMEPQARPVLHYPASASIRTATTASMSSQSIPTIQESHTFDSECSLFTRSSVATEVTRPRSISSVTTAKCRTQRKRTESENSSSSRSLPLKTDENQSIRKVQTEVLPYLPALSATDGYRC